MEETQFTERSAKIAYYSATATATMGTKWKAATVFACIIAVIALAIGILSFDTTLQLQRVTDDLTSESPLEISYPRSCKALDVDSESGLYIIRPYPTMLAFPVYCDMDTDGGGWTLVASVHENNIKGKCTSGDKWSSEQGFQGKSEGNRNWENFNTFGHVEKLTSDDYKNPAYFTVESSDVMIWHVPNGKSPSQISHSAYLKYYTFNRFLERNGGTLRNLYKSHAKAYPFTESGLFPLGKKINETAREILNEVPNWHRYVYDDIDRIHDGEEDLYDGGNEVYYRVNGRANDAGGGFERLSYNAAYKLFDQDIDVFSIVSYPFTALAWIGENKNGGDPVNSFAFRVDSKFGANGGGVVSMYDNTELLLGEMRAMYTAFLVHGAGSDASVCEVYFYIGSTTLWETTYPLTMNRLFWNLRNTRSATNVVEFVGEPTNLLVGYILLSRLNALAVTKDQIRNVLNRYMTLAESFRYQPQIEPLAVPVLYEVGSDDLIRESFPTNYSSSFDPGFIQFRALSLLSTTTALCPGVKANLNSERVCVGGGNNHRFNPEVCGDFSGWAGSPGNPGNETAPSATGRSQRDINSSILIFTR